MLRVNILSTFKGVMFSPTPTFEYLTEKSQQFMEVKPDEWQRSFDFLVKKVHIRSNLVMSIMILGL